MCRGAGGRPHRTVARARAMSDEQAGTRQRRRRRLLCDRVSTDVEEMVAGTIGVLSLPPALFVGGRMWL